MQMFLGSYILFATHKKSNKALFYVTSIIYPSNIIFRTHVRVNGNKKSPFQEDFMRISGRGFLHVYFYLLLFGSAIGITLLTLLVATTNDFA